MQIYMNVQQISSAIHSQLCPDLSIFVKNFRRIKILRNLMTGMRGLISRKW